MGIISLQSIGVPYHHIVAIAFSLIFHDTHFACPCCTDSVADIYFDVGAVVVAVEGAAVAVVCIKYNIPFVVIRALSDKADGNAHESYENFGDTAADNSSRIVIKMLDAGGK